MDTEDLRATKDRQLVGTGGGRYMCRKQIHKMAEMQNQNRHAEKQKKRKDDR